MIKPRIKVVNVRRGFQPSATPPAPPIPPDLATRVAALESQGAAQQATIETQAGQITALQTALSGKASMDDVNAAIVANSSANVNSVDTLDLNPSDPPTQNDVYQAIYRLNVLILGLHRQS